jgi:hypothetical protein
VRAAHLQPRAQRAPARADPVARGGALRAAGSAAVAVLPVLRAKPASPIPAATPGRRGGGPGPSLATPAIVTADGRVVTIALPADTARRSFPSGAATIIAPAAQRAVHDPPTRPPGAAHRSTTMRTFAFVAVAATAVITAAPASAQQAQHAHHDDLAPAAASASASRETPVRTARGRKALRTLSITAHDYAFAMPDTLESGAIVLRLDNRGKEMHHAWIARLDGGRTLADLQAAMQSHGPPPSWFVSVGGPNAAAPSGSAEATVLLQPGTYVALCFIPAADGMPHIMKGMMKQFVVVPSHQTAARLPAAENTMTLSDYDFSVAKPLVAGTQVVRVRNVAAQEHEAVMFQLAPGRKPADVIAWIDKPVGPPPFLSSHGITGVANGVEANITLDLASGEYFVVCFVPDAKDGKPHLAHGMARTITVK